MKFSLSSFVYFRYTLFDAIRRTADLGYDAVELWGGRPHAYCDDMDEKRIAEIRRIVDDTEIAVSNFIPAQFRYPSNLAAGDEQIRQNSVDYIKKSIDAAASVGAPYVSLCPGYSLHGQAMPEGWDCMMKSFRDLLEHSRNMPVNLILEPGNRYETDLVVTVDDGIRAVDELGREMGLLVDTGHLFVNKESLSDIIDKLKGHTCHYHIDDNMGITDDHMVPGEGEIHYDVFIKRLKKSGYEGYLAVELGFQYTIDPDAAAKGSIEFLKKKDGEID